MVRPFFVGLTGGIAEGKTTCRLMFERLGASTLDADCLAHTLYQKGSSTTEQIVAQFGPQVVGENGIDRTALGRIVFNNASAMKQLTDIVWCEIPRLIMNHVETMYQSPCDQDAPNILIIEAAVLFEAHWDKFMDHIVVVHLDDMNTVKQRLHTRNPHLLPEDIDSRVQASLNIRRYLQDLKQNHPPHLTFLDTAVDQKNLRTAVRSCYEYLCLLATQKRSRQPTAHDTSTAVMY